MPEERELEEFSQRPNWNQPAFMAAIAKQRSEQKYV
jgi:hypothetical protein